MTIDAPLLEIADLRKTYPLGRSGALGLGRRRSVSALDGVDLTIRRKEVVALVGESGSGKTTLGRIVVGLEKPTSGSVSFDGSVRYPSETRVSARELLATQMIFQNPVASLNPRQTVAEILAEPARVHGLLPQEEKCFVAELMARVGLADGLTNRRPREMSGGQCQRVGIARALAVNPQLIVCDEAVAALDVSIQAQVLNLFADLQEQNNLSYLFISHDLPVVERLSHRIAIMYLGRIVETAPTKDLFQAPAHPYTQALLASVPRLERRAVTATPIRGEIPSPISPPSGCHFHPRCPYATAQCRAERPKLRQVGAERRVACHLVDADGAPPNDQSIAQARK